MAVTETINDAQRLEIRRALLQTIGEMDRGLKVISGFLKLGRFGMAREEIAGVKAMLILHESMAQHLLKENQRLREELAGREYTPAARSCPTRLMDGRNEIRCWLVEGHEGDCK